MKGHRGLLLAGVAAALFGGLPPTARAGCAGPELEIVQPASHGDRAARLTVGESVIARGRYWINGCNDNGGGSGCYVEPPEPENPIRNIEVRVVGPVTERQHRRERGLTGARFSRAVGERDADANGSFRLSFTVPALPPGRYYLIGSEIEIGTPEPIRITAAGSGGS